MAVEAVILMTKVAIQSEPTNGGLPAFRAAAGGKQSVGRTAGEAVDALVTQLPAADAQATTIVIVQGLRPAPFFTAAQQQRLAELMDRWRAARDAGGSPDAAEQAELDELADAELRGSADRSAALLRELGPRP